MADDTTSPTDGTVADLRDHIATVNDPAELERLRAEEEANKGRATALAAIDAKSDELNNGGTAAESVSDNATGNVTSAPGGTSADANHDEGGAASTTLVQVDDPASLTNKDINEATGDGLKKDASQQQSDAANTLVEARDDAKGKDVDHAEHPLWGYGPGADIG